VLSLPLAVEAAVAAVAVDMPCFVQSHRKLVRLVLEERTGSPLG